MAEPSPMVAKADSPETRRYNRIRRWLEIADFLIGLAFLVVLLAAGWTNELRDWAYRGAGQYYTLAVFFYITMLLAISKVLSFPLDYYGFRLEHRYNLSNQRIRSWVWDQAKTWLITLVIGTVLVELIYWTIRTSPRHWWVIAWAVFIVLSIFFAQIAPVVLFPLFYKFKPLENDSLRNRLLHLSDRAGTHVREVYEWELSEKSKKANAALAGLGTTRRILLADTLLQNYTDDEIESVLAHELGHHVHKHIVKGIVVEVVVSFFGFWITSEILRYAVDTRGMFESLHDFANLPLLVLASTVMSFALMPLMNAYSRSKEREADRYALESIPDVAPFITSMNKLADQNMAEREPSRFVEWFFHSHPAISKRITAAEAWRRTQPQTNADQR
jgi:STE24 endopeptidase